MTPTLCVQILKDLTSAAVFEATKEMAGLAQVKLKLSLCGWQQFNIYFVLVT